MAAGVLKARDVQRAVALYMGIAYPGGTAGTEGGGGVPEAVKERVGRVERAAAESELAVRGARAVEFQKSVLRSPR